MPLVGKLVAQKVSRWACPGIVGLPWRGGCPQVGPRRAQLPEMGPDTGRAESYAQYGFGGHERPEAQHVQTYLLNGL